MTDSILDTTKQMLGIPVEETGFDVDIMTHINAVFSTLTQLGVGPEDGYMIDGNTTEWSDYLGTDPKLNSVKTYMVLRVRLMFDPPSTSFQIESFKGLAEELEWRLNVNREGDAWVDPQPSTTPDEDEL